MHTELDSSDVQIEQIEPQAVLSIRAVAPVSQIGEAVGQRIGLLSNYLRERNLKPAGPPFARYHIFEETETDFEFGVPVARGIQGEGHIAAGELPGGSAVTTWHVGPHNRLGDAYARISEWLQAHGRKPNGAAMEVYYWLDLGTHPDGATSRDSSSWRTLLVQPLK